MKYEPDLFARSNCLILHISFMLALWWCGYKYLSEKYENSFSWVSRVRKLYYFSKLLLEMCKEEGNGQQIRSSSFYWETHLHNEFKLLLFETVKNMSECVLFIQNFFFIFNTFLSPSASHKNFSSFQQLDLGLITLITIGRPL